MAVVFLGIGSNQLPEDNLRLGIAALRERFVVRALSRVYRNPAIGFEGPDFLNTVACVETELTPRAVCEALEEIHDLAGRERNSARFVNRILDIDLLLYDDLVQHEPPVSVPRDDVLNYAFVLGPLADIAPDLVHPETGRTMAEHWRAFEGGPEQLTPVDLDL